MEIPKPLIPDMTLPAPGALPPMRLSMDVGSGILMPPKLVKGAVKTAVPAAVVPMKFP